jgi:hypothetical protein
LWVTIYWNLLSEIINLCKLNIYIVKQSFLKIIHTIVVEVVNLCLESNEGRKNNIIPNLKNEFTDMEKYLINNLFIKAEKMH